VLCPVILHDSCQEAGLDPAWKTGSGNEGFVKIL